MAITNGSPENIREEKVVVAFPAVAGEDFDNGSHVLIDNVSNGCVKKGSATDSVGIAVSEYRDANGLIKAGSAVTVIRTGIISGYSVMPDFGVVVQAGADGVLAEANGADGINVGTVIAANTTKIGDAPEKAILVDFSYVDVAGAG